MPTELSREEYRRWLEGQPAKRWWRGEEMLWAFLLAHGEKNLPGWGKSVCEALNAQPGVVTVERALALLASAQEG